MKNPSNKGHGFERKIAVRLSLWWTEGEREDIFWRNDSGGRGTCRAKRGKKTAYSQGDITLLDPLGSPLLDLFTIELKHGYKDKLDLLSLVDRPQSHSTLLEFWQQACRSAGESNNEPLLIIKRDRKSEVVVIEYNFLEDLCSMYGYNFSSPRIDLTVTTLKLSIVPLDVFLSSFQPENFTHYVGMRNETKNSV